LSTDTKRINGPGYEGGKIIPKFVRRGITAAEFLELHLSGNTMDRTRYLNMLGNKAHLAISARNDVIFIRDWTPPRFAIPGDSGWTRNSPGKRLGRRGEREWSVRCREISSYVDGKSKTFTKETYDLERTETKMFDNMRSPLQ
jgi:hypothetical protein